MKYRVIFSKEAQNDLREISDYIERKTFQLDTANKVIAEIISSTFILQIFPYMYEKVYKNFHSINIKNKKIFYEIDEIRKQVIIYHIFWQDQDYEDLL